MLFVLESERRELSNSGNSCDDLTRGKSSKVVNQGPPFFLPPFSTSCWTAVTAGRRVVRHGDSGHRLPFQLRRRSFRITDEWNSAVRRAVRKFW
jgi:hypothetical protein